MGRGSVAAALAVRRASGGKTFAVHIQTPYAPGSEGNGLGLAFCRQMIERHRGAMEAQSREGEGTRISFTVPIATELFVLEDACRQAQEDAEYEHGSFAVLLFAPADSEAATLASAEALLQRNTHHGDRFLQLDGGRQLAIVAVTNQSGLEAMERRLAGVLAQAGLALNEASALCPRDGNSAQALLAAARAGQRTEAEKHA